jgi:hypothetical protein
MNLIKNLFGGIGKLLAAIFGIFGSLGKSKKGAKAEQAIFLDGADAKGFASESKAATKPAPKATAPKAAASTANAALNLPQPTVTTSSTEPSSPAYSQFGPRRRPGANMKSFMDMAKNANVPVR